MNTVRELLKINEGRTYLFYLFLLLLLLDKIISLIHFGFIYSDVDQLIMWSSAIDYSKGIFNEPFFYGQAYNYMFESLLAAPLIWSNIEVYKALPIVSSALSIFPFVFFAFGLKNRGYMFFSYLSLAFPIFLSIEYNALSILTRGFVQAFIAIPILFSPLFSPKSSKSITLLYLGSALSFILNPSSAIIVFPIFVYVYSYNYKSSKFYLKSLFIIPFLAIYYFSKHYYIVHPEIDLHKIHGMYFEMDTFIKSLHKLNHFEYLFPFTSGYGILYPILLVLLTVIAIVKSKYHEILFIVSFLFILIYTLGVPKVQTEYLNAGVFFSVSRLFVIIPMVFVISLFLIFKKKEFSIFGILILLIISVSSLVYKNIDVNKKMNNLVVETVFPALDVDKLLPEIYQLYNVSKHYNVDVIVNANNISWNLIFNSYGYYPLTYKKEYKVVSINLTDDRRTWLYDEVLNSKVLYLNGFYLDTKKLNSFDYTVIGDNQIIIKLPNNMNIRDFFQQLKIPFGISSH